MADLVVMPKADWQDVLDATREKTGKSSTLLSGELATEIRSITSGDGITPSGTLEITENGTFDVTEYESVEVNVETSGGEAEDLSAELTEQDELLTAIEELLEGGSSAVLTVNFAYEYEDYDDETEDTEYVYYSSDASGSYTVDGGETVYFEDMASLRIECSVGSVVEIRPSSGFAEMSGEYAGRVAVGCTWDFGLCEGNCADYDVHGEFGGCEEGVKITVTATSASIMVYECYC